MLSWLRRRRNAGPAQWDLSSPLLNWSREDRWTLGAAFEGTFICGATGAGKTSGSGSAILGAFLRAGFGGLVLTAKSDERAMWEYQSHLAGRTKDLLIFGPSEPLRFGFLDYEARRKGAGAGHTENVVALFATILEVAERGASASSGRDDEGYWRRACRQLVRNCVDLLMLASGRVSVPELYRVVISAPTAFDQVRSEAWRAQSFCYRSLVEADKRPKSEAQRRDLELVSDYFLIEFPGLSDKTRSVVVSTFTSLADVLNRGVLRELFSGETNVTPDALLDGKVIVLDLPVKEFQDVGVIAQLLWKLAFQRFAERRDIQNNGRPLFLWADEAHYWLTSQDALFQTTCRSSRVATVLLSQNLGNFEAALGGSEKGKAEAASLLGNLNTKLFHANSDVNTNHWASSIIGRTRQQFANGSTSHSSEDWLSSAVGFGAAGQASGGYSEAYEFELQPSDFSDLRTGGAANDWQVDAILFQNGRRFRATGRNWMPVLFGQRHRK